MWYNVAILWRKGRVSMENKDRIIKILAYNGRVSIVCANTTALVEKARITHDIQDKLTFQITGNGPLRRNCSYK